MKTRVDTQPLKHRFDSVWQDVRFAFGLLFATPLFLLVLLLLLRWL